MIQYHAAIKRTVNHGLVKQLSGGCLEVTAVTLIKLVMSCNNGVVSPAHFLLHYVGKKPLMSNFDVGYCV